jgi:molybdopterin/thiamine biosynthesis adenylyltransferase/rhodanese-related sulfurtransferase
LLNKNDHIRYSRQVILPEVGEAGQQKLLATKVLVIGAGGLGCPVLQYLAGAGVGTIAIADSDRVALSNLQRQVLFDVDDIGKSKADSAVTHLRKRNPGISFIAIPERVTNTNALRLLEKFDLVVDCTDNFVSRYLINDACVLTGKALVYGALSTFGAQVSVFNLSHSNKPGATYRDLFPISPLPGTVATCSETGILGSVAGICGTLMATECLKILLSLEGVLSDRLLIIESKLMKFSEISLSRDESVWGNSPTSEDEFINFDYGSFCGFDGSKHTLSDAEIFILDVRESWEEPAIDYPNQIKIPLHELPQRVDELPAGVAIRVVCQNGQRSKLAIKILEKFSKFADAQSVEGGMEGLNRLLSVNHE